MGSDGLDFTLTDAEKKFIRAYVEYKETVSDKPRPSDILEVFAWGNEENTRYVPAHRDFLLDDQRYLGAFAVVRKAIVDEINGLSGSK